MADARVLQSNPNTNYGSLSRLDVDSPGEESYIRFNVTGVTGTVQNAMLRLFVKSGSSDAPAIHATDNSWTETGITWNNRPAPTTSALANLGALSSSTWAEYDLTAHIAGDGVYSFVLIADSSDGIRFESREGNPAPELVLTFTSGPAPTATATALSTTVAPTATDTPAPAATATATPTETPVNTATPTATASPTPAAPTPTASPTPGSSSVTLAAAADARVLQSNPNTNYGTLSRLDVDSPGEESYIRFNVSGVTGAVQSATLRLFVSNASSNGPSIYATGNSWTETGLTWNNRPAPTSGVLANLGSAPGDTWAEYDLTAHISGNGTYSFVLLADSSDGIRFESREGSPAPELVLTFTSGPAPTPTDTPNPPTATSTPAATASPTPTATATASPTATSTPTATATSTPTDTPDSPTATTSPTPTATPSPTATASPTPAAPTATASPTPGSSSVTLAAAADARVLQSNPNTNYGTLSRLDVDSPGEESYIRFNVSGVTGAVQSATLRLFVSNASSNGPSIYATGNSWTETGITWNNRPAPTSGVLANLGSAPDDTWAEYDLTAHISGNGTYSFVLLADSSDGIRFESREGSPAPELVLTFTSGPAPTPTATATSGPSPTPTATATASPTPTSGPSPTPTATPSSGSVIFVGAGDIADCSRVEDEMTAQLLDNIPGTVFTIGDNANPNGTAAQFNDCYEPTWGRHKARTHPAAGDNEYNSSSNAAAYFNYFGAAAGNPDEGWYSYNVGSWHIIVLNSNCSQVGGCEPDSPQGQWLQADLAANSSACTLAIHHEPLFSSKGGDDDLADFWEPLYEAGAEIVLSGHRHMYERFARQNPDGVADPERGIRQFVVGTGGNSLTSPPGGVAPNSEVRNNTAHGVLKFTLHPTSYDWEFIPIAGQTFTDSGSESCVIP